MSAYVCFDTELQRINNHNIYNDIKLLIGLNGGFIYGFIIVIAIILVMGHVLSCWIVA